MKKFILLALTVILSTGLVMADKKCCKNNEKCTKTACAKKSTGEAATSCAGKTDATSKKACCANKTEGSASAASSCSQSAGKKACCKDKAKAEAKAEPKINDDGTVAE